MKTNLSVTPMRAATVAKMKQTLLIFGSNQVSLIIARTRAERNLFSFQTVNSEQLNLVEWHKRRDEKRRVCVFITKHEL